MINISGFQKQIKKLPISWNIAENYNMSKYQEVIFNRYNYLL